MKSLRPREWSKQEAQRLIALARQKTCAGDVARELDRHVTSVRKKGTRTRLATPEAGRRLATPWEVKSFNV